MVRATDITEMQQSGAGSVAAGTPALRDAGVRTFRIHLYAARKAIELYDNRYRGDFRRRFLLDAAVRSLKEALECLARS